MATEHVDVAIIGGGQSGLAAARAAKALGTEPVVLEGSGRTTGSWPRYYDSLTLFSPARFSALPDLPLGGDGNRYPHRDEIADYLVRYAERLQVDIRTRARVEVVEADEAGFAIRTADGHRMTAAGIVAATGAFGNPARPELLGQEGFAGEVLHVADYHDPQPYAGKRIVVVGGGNSAVQVGHELARVATVTLATHAPLHFLPQVRGGKDLHHWLTTTGFDHLPPAWLAHVLPGTLVLDPGDYQNALHSGRWHRRPMLTRLEGESVIWDDGTRESVDVVLLATGYRPDLPYLRTLDGALGDGGGPVHSGGLSLTHPGLVYLGLEFQRSFASNTLRGVSRDADHVIPPLAAHVHRAPGAAGL
ncbi:NAD(P)/FAD-dependent oxidoreductase [Streptomyces sp. RKND-216]|uniref:flavin-containing monooxygenase n=1 Tax=Streptomyces sp. RKND-216 TaxID=2562581 RepID=UPI001FF9B9B1|nr:NAD(P)/FAD-dependent oxidoreductase [Streptomyces sp. RKND-216]